MRKEIFLENPPKPFYLCLRTVRKRKRIQTATRCIQFSSKIISYLAEPETYKNSEETSLDSLSGERKLGVAFDANVAWWRFRGRRNYYSVNEI